MAVTFTTTYLGDLRTAMVHGPSGTRVLTDAPVDNHGKGEAFSPTDLVASALGSCMLTIMGIVAKRDGIALDGTLVAVAKHMTSELPRRIARIEVAFTMAQGIAPEVRAKLEKAAHTCPVALSLHPDIAQVVTFTWPD
jgi:putative redox protein